MPMTDQIAALRAEFKAKHDELHREWTAAVGTPGYVKAPWRERDNALTAEYRDRLDRLGYRGPLIDVPAAGVSAPETAWCWLCRHLHAVARGASSFRCPCGCAGDWRPCPGSDKQARVSYTGEMRETERGAEKMYQSRCNWCDQPFGPGQMPRHWFVPADPAPATPARDPGSVPLLEYLDRLEATARAATTGTWGYGQDRTHVTADGFLMIRTTGGRDAEHVIATQPGATLALAAKLRGAIDIVRRAIEIASMQANDWRGSLEQPSAVINRFQDEVVAWARIEVPT